MIDIERLIEAMNSANYIYGIYDIDDAMNENMNNRPIYKNKNDRTTVAAVLVRSSETGGYAGNRASHGLSVKFSAPGVHNGKEPQQSVPNTPIDLNDKKSMFMKHYTVNHNNPLLDNYIDGFYAFVYIYQMEICALWYTDDVEVREYLIEVLTDDKPRISTKTKAKPKTEKQLREDRKRIVNDVRKNVRSDAIVSFGKVHDNEQY